MDAESSLHEKLTAEYDRIKGLDAENARLKADIQMLLLKHEKEKNTLLIALEAATKEIARLKEVIAQLCDDDYGDALTLANAKNEQLLLKHEKEKNTLLVALEAATREKQ